MNREGKRSVSLEDLLRLKRAERPPDSFWADFDRQLRAKQLSALVEKRPWWHGFSLSGLISGVRRHPVPLGAAVALGFGSFVFVRGYRTAAPEPIVVVSSVPAVAKLQSAVLPAAEVVSSAWASNVVPVAPFVVAASETPALEISAEVTVTSAEAARSAFSAPDGDASRPLFFGNVPLSLEAQSALLTASAEAVASGPLLGGSTRVEARAPASRAVVEPLRQITPPADRRGSRILTAMVSMSSVENAMRTTERAAIRLSEEQLYDQIRRVGAVGAAVNVKF